MQIDNHHSVVRMDLAGYIGIVAMSLYWKDNEFRGPGAYCL